jgi:hypothetical protein
VAAQATDNRSGNSCPTCVAVLPTFVYCCSAARLAVLDQTTSQLRQQLDAATAELSAAKAEADQLRQDLQQERQQQVRWLN